MGGCFSKAEPANGRPWQADAAPREQSMCQSILDLFKKCVSLRRDDGGPKLPDDSIDAQLQRAKDITKKSELEMEEFESQKERVRERFNEINSIINKNAASALDQFESGDPSEAGGD